ncbi:MULTISPECIES: efflux RND transporter periplasmic adaptor subunit [unclassified Psychrobacter]|jgi:macrolide-specific efflux system membrane fusion protein|uniref:efflux RND transporter periplasmic adaptor subunit n=1 Tax=unclassified Psychrobacter TaxID=196806 RepID=UPI00086C156D|nr:MULTISPECIES: efflux RND transporter periplasmic adaptor subunit [unclassified Psychrobacter]MBA6245060.1 efflux RND transporter periplasmic adaptor subunit [Psychrobacter sp. Urea-trap-18]MBA6286663.1 efflux RND transporter periplasmic adaptor subunit [Psychrobacter sp. Urea-trap-16]MBA6317878.1 efflux RND transporter periplasmic adaptor subunit [Psychrobacter sp. Urea-trap-20]MBA6334387.1 efflux RND transporter periplasmic adaptor subunit [Psychrobacter sp. Urea-trap-19]OEH68411.1 MAG: ef|tara:strand:+ start:1035 stop:2360 length:1326 start_codon:yes stop_codon:yes gene_type:complete
MHKISKKSAIKWGVITLIIVALGALAYTFLKPEETTPNYLTATVEVGDIENNVMASGKVKALNTVDVGAQVSGEVKRLYVEVGDEVKQGDLIAQIDQVTQKNSLSNEQASLEQSEAALQSAQAESLSKQASLKSAYADLASRQSELKQAQSDFARLQDLVAIDAISQQEYDTQATSVETAKAAVANARAAIDTAKAAIATTEANINSQQAALRKSRTNVSTAEEDLSYTTIRAPISGTVVSITTEQGTTVNANQTAPTLVTLADLSTVRINAQISEADVINVSAGMPAYFNIIGNPDKQYDATLTAIEPAPEQISSTSSTDAAIYYVGYVEVPNPDRLFRIDMTAQIYIIVNEAKNTLLVPSTVIQEKRTKGKEKGKVATGKFVRVLRDDGTVEERTVEVGIDNRVNAQILSGLKEGEEVIISEESGKKSDSGRVPGGPQM